MRSSGEQPGPATPFERGFYALAITVILGLLAAEIINDFKPVKLAALFFVLFWPLLLVMHEAGHALMADLLGWEVRRVVIGFNKEVWRIHIRGVPILIKLIPLGGYIIPAPRNLSAPRLKLALIYLAGPGIELLLLAVLVAVLGLPLFVTPSEDYGVIALQALAVVILFGAVTNLLPVPYQDGSKTTVSDGLGFFRSFTLPDQHFVALMGSAPEEDEPRDDDWWQRGDEGWATDRDPDRWRQ
jgi:Zn-dependent protease